MIHCEKLEPVLKALKDLLAEQKRYEAMRDKAGSMNHATHTMRRIESAHVDMNFQAVHVRRCHKAAWAAIVAAGLETTLTPEEANPSGFHKYEI